MGLGWFWWSDCVLWLRQVIGCLLSLLLSFASPKESNKEKETTKTNCNFFFLTSQHTLVA